MANEAKKIQIKPHLSFILILTVTAVVCALYAYNIYRWANIPDFGFGFRTATGIEVVGILNEHGRNSGLEAGDRILSVNGQKVKTYLELQYARNWEKSGENVYLIKRNDRQFPVVVPNVPLGFKRVFKTSGFTFLLGLGFIVIGTLVYLMKSYHRTSKVFFNFGIIFGLFATFLYKTSFMKPLWMETVVILAYTFTPSSFFHLALSFPEERSILAKNPKIKFLPYFVSAILFAGIRFHTPTMFDAPKTWLLLTVAYMALSVLFFLGSSLLLRLTSISAIVKTRARMILLGFAIAASVPLIDFLFNSLFKVYLVPNFNYYLPFFLVFPSFVAYSIVKHDLFDIDTIIKRTYGYVLTTGSLAGIYGLFVLGSNIVFGQLEITQSRLFPLVFILIIVFLFNPIRNRVQHIIDRIFYRLEYDYQATVKTISETMRSLLNLEEIGSSIMNIVRQTMFIESGGVMLLDRKEAHYQYLTFATDDMAAAKVENDLSRAAGHDLSAPPGEHAKTGHEVSLTADSLENKAAKITLSAGDPLVQKIASRKKEVTIYDINEDPFFEKEREACQKIFEGLDATLIVPLIYENELTGLVPLGSKKSGKFYRREDIDLLNILANQGAVAIENARLFQENLEKQRMEEELNIARDLQMSMLPSACPQVQGYGFAAFSLQAREVGGDFYDFTETKAGGTALVIGDVTGKSVSGALVMSASRSIFRMLSEEDLNVAEIMIRANRRSKKDIKSGMFVALLYAVLDPENQALSLCSAGQTQPIHIDGKTGDVALIETQGDTFPLGILEDVDYQETRLALAAGDKIIFYTDGIVEAMNTDEEIFGFERLMEAVKGTEGFSPEELLAQVKARVDAFVGNAPQHDDLTVIILSVDAEQAERKPA